MDKNEFREYMEAEHAIALDHGNTRRVVFLGRMLRNKRVFNRVFKKARKSADKRYGGSLSDWLADIDWEELFRWIMAIMALFSGAKK